MQHFLKAALRTTRTEIVAAELFGQLDVAMDETPSTLDLGFRGE